MEKPAVVHISDVMLHAELFFYKMVELVSGSEREDLRYLAAKAESYVSKSVYKMKYQLEDPLVSELLTQNRLDFFVGYIIEKF